MLHVAEATEAQIDDLVGLESALFREDAGRYDPYADTTWPAREGRADLAHLIASPEGLVLAATLADDVVGLLVGYVTPASPSRQPVTYAILRTMYVAERARREGVGAALVCSFLDWARQLGCAEAHVDHYAANAGAAALYERCGFEPRSVSRALTL